MGKWQLTADEWKVLLRGLNDVSESKPVSYLPLRTIEEILQLSPEAVAAGAVARGLAVAWFGPAESCIKSGALYVFHRTALRAVLQERAEAVRSAGLPLDPDGFVAHIAATWFGEEHPAMPLIAAAFGHSPQDKSKQA